MGGNSSKPKTDIVTIDSKEFAYAHGISDLHFGEGHLYRNEETEEMILKVPRLDNDEEQNQQRLEDCEIWSHIQHHFLVNLKKYDFDKKREVCSTFWQIMLYYEYLPHTLSREILYRKTNGLGFDESEIFFVAKCLLSSLDFIQAKGQLHEDVRPFNVLISDDGIVKLLCNRILKAGMSQANMIRAHNLYEECYLSPMLLESLVSNNQPFAIPFKSDSFSVGLILLEMATLRRNFRMYDFETGVISKIKIERRLQLMSQKFSNQLVELTKRLLEFEETRRPDPGQLLTLIPHNRTATRLLIAKEALHQSKREIVSMYNTSNFTDRDREPENKLMASRISMKSGRGRMNNSIFESGKKYESIAGSPIRHENNVAMGGGRMDSGLVLRTEYSQKEKANEAYIRADQSFSNFKINQGEIQREAQMNKVNYSNQAKTEGDEILFDFVYNASDYNAPFKAINVTNTTHIDSTHRSYYLLEKYRNIPGGNLNASVAQNIPAAINYSPTKPAYQNFGGEKGNMMQNQMLAYGKESEVNYGIGRESIAKGQVYTKHAYNAPFPVEQNQNQFRVGGGVAAAGGKAGYQNPKQNLQYVQTQNGYISRSPQRQNLAPINVNPNVNFQIPQNSQAYNQYNDSRREMVSNENYINRAGNIHQIEEKKLQILNEAKNDNIERIINSVKEEHRRRTMSTGINSGIEEYRRGLA